MLFAHKPLEKKSSTKTLRSWRSNPQLRSPNEPPLSKTLLFPDEGGFYRPTTSFEHIPDSNDPLLYLQLPRNTHSHHLLTPNHNSTTPAAVLNLGNNSTKRSRSSSIPLLSHCSTSNLSARGMLSGPVQPISSTATNDVLGQILGWSTTMLSAKPSTSTLSPSKRSQATPKVSSSASRLKHVSSVSYSSSADAGDEASQEGSFDHSSYEKRSQTDEVLPIDLQEELAESHEQSPPHSPGPSTPTLTLSNVRSLNYFPSNESNTVRFEPDQSNASKSSAGSPRQTKTPPQSNESPARVPPLIHQSPFGQGVKLKSRTLKRKKPLPQSESAHAIETSFLEIAQGSDERSHSRFQDTAIFDVLQALELHADAFTYDGGAAVSMDSLPGLSALNKGQFHRHSRAGSTSSLLSVSSNASSLLPRNAQQITVSAAPSDDPRFVIWGEKQPTTSSKPSLTSQDSSSVLSSTASPATSRRWSRKASTSSHDPAVKHASSFQTVLPPQKMLMAATVERWVAELTSKIDPELLADFFLAYRSFLSPYSLCELLVTRFNWALAEPSSPEDEAARRIVRVRSFVVIRHWLLNYFIEDFVPDSQLRGLLTSWLNNTAKSYQIKSSPSDQRLVKNLKKVVRRLKDQYVNIGSALEQGAAQLSAALDSQSAGDAGIHSQSSGPAIVLDEDVDLNFTTYNTSHAPHQRSVSAGRKGTEGMLLPVSPPKERRRSTTASSREVLHDRLGQTGKLVKTHPSTTSPSRAAHPSTYLPVSHSPVSRAVTSTLGQFGRLKRMIQNRSSPTVASEELASHDGPAVDVFSQVQTESSSNPSSPSIHQSSSASMTSTSEVETPDEGDILTSPEVSDTSNTSSSGLGISRSMEAEDPMLRHSLSNQTIKSDLRASKGKRVSQSLNSEPPAHAPPKQSSTWTSSAGHRASVVQLDDVGLSDESDDEEVELPRTLRRLPAARDLRQAEALRQLRPQTSKATMSSLATRKSSRLFKRPSFASFRSGSSNHSQDSADEHAPGVITNFVIDGLESDDEEESGDVEAALRRLEGQIDSEKQKIKAARVERQMAKSAAAADSGLEPQHESADEQDDNPVGETRTPRSSASADPEEQARSAVVSTLINPEIGDSASSGPRMLTPEPPGLNAPDLPHDMRSSSPAHHSSSEVPAKTRLSTLRLSMGRKPSIRNLLSRTHPPLETAGPQSKLSIPPTMQPAHRSFVLLCKTEVLARQFCLIERDLLSNISWHE